MRSDRAGTGPTRVARGTPDPPAGVMLIDWTRCDGHGTCSELLPELLEPDPWGYPLPRSRGQDVEIPRRSLDRARRAVRACPLAALQLQPPT